MNHAKLNALVAERVMGWTYEQQNGSVDGARDKEGQYHVFTPGYEGYSNFWSPATSIAHAHEMRDKVLSAHPDWYAMSITQHGVRCKVSLVSITEQSEVGEGEHGQEPVAWCLAALRAEGVTDKEIEEVCK